MEDFKNISIEELREREKECKIKELNQTRDEELSSIIIDNILINESIINTMKIELDETKESENVEWINIHNKIVKFTKDEFNELIKKGIFKIKEIYLKYRKEKDNLEDNLEKENK